MNPEYVVALEDALEVAVEALQSIATGETETYDEDLQCNVTVSMDADFARIRARQSLGKVTDIICMYIAAGSPLEVMVNSEPQKDVGP